MAALFSIPPYPNAVSYNVQYSDPSATDPNAPNPLGPWTNLSSGSVTSSSNIFDPGGDPTLRLYRVQPVITNPTGGAPIPLIWYDAFSASQTLYDPQITGVMLNYFRNFIADYGTPQISSTNLNMDTGAGSGLLIFDGVTTIFNLADIPDAEPAVIIEGTVSVVKNNRTLLRNVDYYVDYEAGQVIFATAPAATDTCYIKFRQSDFSNRQLNEAVRVAIDSLTQLGINGFYSQMDNNVVVLPSVIPNNGIRALISQMGLKIMHRAAITLQARRSREYQVGDFRMNTAPARLLDGMATAAQNDWSEIKAAANNYIRTATTPISVTTYDRFFDNSGAIPTFSFLLGTISSYLWYI